MAIGGINWEETYSVYTKLHNKMWIVIILLYPLINLIIVVCQLSYSVI